jgi:hypothetical protein
MGRGEWTSWEFGAQGKERVFPFLAWVFEVKDNSQQNQARTKVPHMHENYN